MKYTDWLYFSLHRSLTGLKSDLVELCVELDEEERERTGKTGRRRIMSDTHDLIRQIEQQLRALYERSQ